MIVILVNYTLRTTRKFPYNSPFVSVDDAVALYKDEFTVIINGQFLENVLVVEVF